MNYCSPLFPDKSSGNQKGYPVLPSVRQLLQHNPFPNASPSCPEMSGNSYQYGSAKSSYTSQTDNLESYVSESSESSWKIDKQINYIDSSASTTIGDNANDCSYSNYLTTPRLHTSANIDEMYKVKDNGMDVSLFYQEVHDGSTVCNFDMLFYNNSPIKVCGANKNDAGANQGLTSESCNSLKGRNVTDDDSMQNLLLLTPQISSSCCSDSNGLLIDGELGVNKSIDQQYNSLSELFLNANELNVLSPFSMPFEGSNSFMTTHSVIANNDCSQVKMNDSIGFIADNKIVETPKETRFSSRNKRNISFIHSSVSKKEKYEME